MATEIWVNIGSGNGLLPDGTWTNVDWSSVKSSDIHIRAISQEMPQPSITKICMKSMCLKFHSNFPGANELIHSQLGSFLDNEFKFKIQIQMGLILRW